MKNQLFAMLAIALLFASCKKDTNVTNPVTSADVYVAGVQSDAFTGRQSSSVWKNGAITTNTLSVTRNHFAYAIAVYVNNDVYTTGFKTNQVNGNAMFGKTGNINMNWEMYIAMETVLLFRVMIFMWQGQHMMDQVYNVPFSGKTMILVV